MTVICRAASSCLKCYSSLSPAKAVPKNDPVSPMQSNFEEIQKWFLSDSELIHHRQPQISSLTFMFDFQVQIFLLSRARRIITRSFFFLNKKKRLEITSVYRITIFQKVTRKKEVAEVHIGRKVKARKRDKSTDGQTDRRVSHRQESSSSGSIVTVFLHQLGPSGSRRCQQPRASNGKTDGSRSRRTDTFSYRVASLWSNIKKKHI